MSTSVDFSIKRGDTGRPLRVRVEDDSGRSFNSIDHVRFTMVSFETDENGVPIRTIVGSGAVDNAGQKILRYDWAPFDTDTPCRYRAEFLVRFSDGAETTYPSNRDLNVIVNERVDEALKAALIPFPNEAVGVLDSHFLSTALDTEKLRVTMWHDLADIREPAVAIAGVALPLYSEDGGPAGGPAVEFTGTQALDFTSAPILPNLNDWTMYVLLQIDTSEVAAGSSAVVLSQYISAANNGRTALSFSKTADSFVLAIAESPSFPVLVLDLNYSPAPTEFVMLRVTRVGAEFELAVEDVSVTVSDPGNPILQTGVLIGNQTASATGYKNLPLSTSGYKGKILHCAVYSAAHTTENGKAEIVRAAIRSFHGLV